MATQQGQGQPGQQEILSRKRLERKGRGKGERGQVGHLDEFDTVITPHGSSRPSVTPFPGDPSGLCRYCTHTDMHIGKTDTHTHRIK